MPITSSTRVQSGFDQLQDLRFTLRPLSRYRAFTAIAIPILAIGIGTDISVFSVVKTILLSPLPFPDSHQLTWLVANYGKGGALRRHL